MVELKTGNEDFSKSIRVCQNRGLDLADRQSKLSMTGKKYSGDLMMLNNEDVEGMATIDVDESYEPFEDISAEQVEKLNMNLDQYGDGGNVHIEQIAEDQEGEDEE